MQKDNPVGTGFGFVEEYSLLVKTDVEAATDLTEALKTLDTITSNPSSCRDTISFDGRWYMAVFHVPDLNGYKLTDENVIYNTKEFFFSSEEIDGWRSRRMKKVNYRVATQGGVRMRVES